LQDLDDKNNEGSLSYPFRTKHTKNSTLRIKPLFMKKRWRSTSTKKYARKKWNNSNKVQLEEDSNEGPTDLLALDLSEICHKVNSLCSMIVEKYDFSDEESIDKYDSHKVKCVENSNQTTKSSLLFDENDVV
jgi:hypothetical protein